MKAVRTIAISGLILAGSIAGFVVLGQKPEVPTQEVADAKAAVEVITARVTKWDQPFNINVDGEAATYRIVTVGSEVVGRITSKSVESRSGTFVTEGTLLFEVDSTNYQLRIDQLKAQLSQIDEELKAIDVDLHSTAEMLTLAEEDRNLQAKQLSRMKELQTRRTANESEVEQAMKQELAARNSLQTLRNRKNSETQQRNTKLAGRKLIEAELARAEVDLKRCKVFSPLNGRIVDDVVEEGDYVKEGDPLVHISDSSRMEIKTKLRAEEVAWVWQQHADLSPNSEGSLHSTDPLNLPRISCEIGYEFEGLETIWDGRIARIEGTGIDRDTRTFPCRILVEEPQKTRFNESAGGHASISPPTLLSGMFVNVRIPVESPVPLLRLPMESIRPGGQVWVNRDGVMDILQVRIANVQDSNALIRATGSQLHEGDRVIVSPLTSVRQGMKIEEAGKKTSNTTDKAPEAESVR